MTGAKSGLDAALFLDEPEEYVVTPALGSNRDICFVSKNHATNKVEIVVSGNDTPLSVSAAAPKLTINSATDADGDPTSTAAQIVAAVNADAGAFALFEARLPPGSTGAGVTGELAETTAADGVAFTDLELTDSGDHLTFQAAAGSRYWDEGETLSVEDNGSAAADYTVNYLRGSVTFGSTKSGHTITATGTRRSILAFEKVFGCFECKLKIGSTDIDTTTGEDDYWTSSIAGAKLWELSYGHYFYNGEIPISKLATKYFWKVYSTLSTVPFAVGIGTIQSMENLVVDPKDAQKQNGTVKGSGELYLE